MTDPMDSVRLDLQPICQRLPAPHQVTNAHGFLGVAGHDGVEHLHFITQQAKRLHWLRCSFRHLLILCECVAGQDYAVVGDLICGHENGCYKGNFR